MKLVLLVKRFYLGRNNAVKDIFTLSFLTLVSFTTSLWVFKETPRGLLSNKIPLAGDGLLTGLYIKIVEQSSYISLLLQNITSNRFGWPNKLDFTSYPVGNTQEMLGIKIFMDLTRISDPSQIIHIFSISKAVPIAIAFYILARIVGISRILSFGTGLIFSLSSFNLVRAEGHFFLALTWSLPLGFAAIYLAFKQVHRDLPLSKKAVGIVTLLGLFSFMTGFYFSFFLLIFAFISLIYLTILVSIRKPSQTNHHRIKNSIISLTLPVYVFLIYLLGLLLQTIPILIRSRAISNLTGLADRSAVEAIIYAGTPESLLFDFYAFGLRIFKRPDLVAYLQSRISWEGSQVGALSGAVLVFIFVSILSLGVIKLLNIPRHPSIEKIELDSAAAFVTLMLSTSLLFYFVSPLNFAVSRFLPQIRAWGRLSVVISLLTLLLLGLLLTRFKKSDFIVLPVVIIFVLIPISEVNQFHLNRPLSSILNESTITQNRSFQSDLSRLRAIYPANCSLVNLPIYPFPEFDRPDDKNIDYGQLQIPLLDEGFFRWSYAGIKATENFTTWQPLISEFPPFARASIGEQISYSELIGACGALIDRTYLNEFELNEFEKILVKRSQCVSEFKGPIADSETRFVSISFRGERCKFTTELGETIGLDDSPSKKLLWRIDQSSDLGFVGSFQVFPLASTINLRLRANLKDNTAGYVLKIKIFSENPINESQFKLQISNSKNGEVQSIQIRPDSQGLAQIQLPPTLLSGELEKFSASLLSIKEQENVRWGIQVGIQN